MNDKANDEGKRDGISNEEKTKSFDDIPRDLNSWILNSGATGFIHPDRNQFIDYRTFKVPQNIHDIGSNATTMVDIDKLYH